MVGSTTSADIADGRRPQDWPVMEHRLGFPHSSSRSPASGGICSFRGAKPKEPGEKRGGMMGEKSAGVNAGVTPNPNEAVWTFGLRSPVSSRGRSSFVVVNR